MENQRKHYLFASDIDWEQVLSDYLFLANVGDEITNSVYLSKFIPNRMSQSKPDVTYKVGVYTQNFESISWKKIDEIEFNQNNNIVLNSNDYDLCIGQLAVIIPVDVSVDLKDEYVILPKPLGRKIDLSPVNERAAISFTKANAPNQYHLQTNSACADSPLSIKKDCSIDVFWLFFCKEKSTNLPSCS